MQSAIYKAEKKKKETNTTFMKRELYIERSSVGKVHSNRNGKNSCALSHETATFSGLRWKLLTVNSTRYEQNSATADQTIHGADNATEVRSDEANISGWAIHSVCHGNIEVWVMLAG